MTPTERLRAELKVLCEAYMARHGCGASTLSHRALGDFSSVHRVLRGANMTIDKLQRLEAFLLDPANQAPPAEADVVGLADEDASGDSLESAA